MWPYPAKPGACAEIFKFEFFIPAESIQTQYASAIKILTVNQQYKIFLILQGKKTLVKLSVIFLRIKGFIDLISVKYHFKQLSQYF